MFWHLSASSPTRRCALAIMRDAAIALLWIANQVIRLLRLRALSTFRAASRCRPAAARSVSRGYLLLRSLSVAGFAAFCSSSRFPALACAGSRSRGVICCADISFLSRSCRSTWRLPSCGRVHAMKIMPDHKHAGISRISRFRYSAGRSTPTPTIRASATSPSPASPTSGSRPPAAIARSDAACWSE